MDGRERMGCCDGGLMSPYAVVLAVCFETEISKTLKVESFLSCVVAIGDVMLRVETWVEDLRAGSSNAKLA